MKRFLLSLLAVAALALPASAQRLSGNYLDLTSGSVQTPHAADLNAFPLTVTAWVRTTGSAGFKEIVTKYVGLSNNGYSVHIVNGRVYAWYFVSSGRSVYGGGQGLDGGLINDGAWHHIAYTVDAAGGKLYVDGVLKNSLAWTGTPGATTTTTPLGIGLFSNPPPSPTEQVDEVTVWNVARTAAQIDASRTATLVGNEAGLVAYYRCDETSGTAVIDADGGAHLGTIQPGGSRGGPLTGNVIVNSDVLVSNTPGDLNTYPLTLSAWIRTRSNSATTSGILTKVLQLTGPSSLGYALHLQDGRVYGYYRASAGSIMGTGRGVDGGFVADGAWHFLTYTVDAAGGKIYVDGVLKNSLAWSGTPGATTNSSDVHIGAFLAGFPYTGQIDQAAVWNVARTGADIAAATAQRLAGNEPGLLAYFPFDEASGLAIDARGTHPTVNVPTRVPAYAALGIGIGGRVTSGGAGLPGTTVVARSSPAVSTTVVPIPDVSTVDSTLAITLPEPIEQVRVNVNIAHSFTGDLAITLIHPDGTQVALKAASVHDDGTNLTTSYPDLTVPAQSLAVFAGKIASGTWTLRVSDAFAADTGSILGWGLSFGLSATTDANGDYVIPTSTPLNYTVEPVRGGFVFTPDSRVVPSNTTGPDLATGADFAVVTAQITGRITANGVGLAGVTVNAGAFSAVTDANGDFILSGLPPGTYAVTALLAGYGFVGGTVNSALGDVVFFTTSTYPIAGRITDTQGGGVPGVVVSATGGFSGTSDAAGYYLIPAVTPGARTVTPSKGGVVFTPANRNATVPPAATGVDFSANSLPPTITTLADVVIAKGGATGALRFDVADVETRPGLLTVAATASDPLLVPAGGIALGGVGEARTITLTPDPTRTGTATITLTVTDESGLSATTSFALRVNAAPIPGEGRALSFNGTSDAVLVTGNVFDFKGNYAIECWANAPASTVARTLIAQGTGAGGLVSLGRSATGTIVSGPWNTGIAWPAGAWHHIAVVKETANARLYIDGVLRASRGNTLPLATQNARCDIGRSLAGGDFWLGQIDELRVWNGPRTAAQIAANQNVRVFGSDPGLSALWRFDEATGATASDSTAHAFHGAITGATRLRSPITFPRYAIAKYVSFTDQLQAYDEDADALTFALVTPAVRGTVAITDATTGAFTYTPNAGAEGTDTFTFSVSDGTVTSDASLVTIDIAPDLTAPTITAISSLTIAEDGNTGALAFTIGDAETPLASLTLSVTSSNPTLVPAANIVFGGSGANRTVTATPVANGFGTSNITVTVSDGVNSASRTFTLTVTSVPDAPTITPGPRFADQTVVRGATSLPATFTLADVDTPLENLTVTPVWANTALIPTVTVGGAGADRTLTFTGSASLSGSISIAVQVSDGTTTTSLSFLAAVAQAPTIAAVGNQSGYSGGAGAPIALSLGDPDTAVNSLVVTAASSDPLLIPASGLVITGTGANRTLVITPAAGMEGTATITITVYDGPVTSALTTLLTTRTFTVGVVRPPEYEFIELPRQNTNTSIAVELNDVGQIVGYSQFGGGANRPLLWDVTGPPTVTVLRDVSSIAFGINDAGQIVGSSSASTGGFLYRAGTVTDLAGFGYDINASGLIVGGTPSPYGIFTQDGITQKGFSASFHVPSIPDISFRRPRINNRGDVAGVSVNTSTARLWQLTDPDAGTRIVRDFGNFGGLSGIVVSGINNTNQIALTIDSDSPTSRAAIFNYSTNTEINLASALAAVAPGYSSAADINDSGEVVGTINEGEPVKVPYLYSNGRAFDLRALVDSGGVQILGASAINNRGDIVGIALKSDIQVPYLLRRKPVDVGQPIPPPPAAVNSLTSLVYRAPGFEALDGTPLEEAAQAFYWSPVEQRAYLLRPIVGRLTWFTSSDLLDVDARIVRRIAAGWPANPQIMVAGAPAQLDPLDATSPYRAFSNQYSTVSTTSYDASTKTIVVPLPGYTVIRYLLAPEVALGGFPDPTTHASYFQVVRSIVWNDPAYLLDGQTATVGTKVTDPRNITDSPKSGWAVFPGGPYDGAGNDKAYDRATQTGPIIPVNVDTAASNDDLAVAFYKKHPLTGVLWPDHPVRFTISWPGAETLVVANAEGSGPLSTVTYPSRRVYAQDNPALPGFNPNEEHAFLAPSTAGEGVFALRTDLNARSGASLPYVLLKYRDPATNEWRFKTYSVVLEDDSHRFVYEAEAGQELQPPYPVSLLPLCDESAVVFGNAFGDVRGHFYARSGPRPGDQNPRIGINYYYPLQPTFFYDLNGDGGSDKAVGAHVPWDRTSTTPLTVEYRVHWPTDVPTLALGETLLTAKHGLPGIKDFANAQVVFDSLDPDGTTPLVNSARLYDPLSARSLRLADVPGVSASYQFPAEAGMALVLGQGVFPKLPFEIRSRLSYDPASRTLSFAGFLDSSVLGEPLLLTNVMTTQEKVRIKALSTKAEFSIIIDALYDLTRNPNKVNFALPGQLPPTKDLLIGFTTKWDVGGNLFYGPRPESAEDDPKNFTATIVREPLGALPKALTAGLPSFAPSEGFGTSASFGPAGYVRTLSSDQNEKLNAYPLTITAWVRTSSNTSQRQYIVSKSGSGSGYTLYLDNGSIYGDYFRPSGGEVFNFTGVPIADGAWHHVAFVINAGGGAIYVDGSERAYRPWTGSPGAATTTAQFRLGKLNDNHINFTGELDEVALWNVARSLGDIRDGMSRVLTGREPGLLAYWKFDETNEDTFYNRAAPNDLYMDKVGSVPRVPSTIPLPIGGLTAPRYLTIAENNDASLGALPITLHVIRVDGGPFRGDVKVIFPDNVFDERLTLRHSSDFGGDPDPLTFEWWYHPDNAEFSPTALPLTDSAGNITDARGWIPYKPGTAGLNSITIGEGGDSGVFTLIDKWFVVRYRGYTVSGALPWSPWVGDPGSTTLTRAAFAPGWIKRVIEGINPFEQRVKDFHTNAVNTYSSMLIQAGQRFEGPIALNPSGANLNGLGLIEIYSTVLDRGKSLSIDGAPAVDSDPANNALLLAAGRVSDLYMLLGNEAYADALDPTIGYDTSGQFGTAAPSIFAFQNQLDSQLDEELALLRGRDDSAAGVGAAPVYNRLLWNFTGSDGEVAYAQCYNVSDQNRDGSINEFDARIMFPQGHGDAWGHYLTGLTGYYDLLKNPNFTWVPRPETTLIAGTAVQVDFLDERKFAKAAAAKARTGAQVVDLTYRLNYVEDPNGQFQGYKDTDVDRAWGVSEWARRAGQGSYFDWVAANAILPSTDPNPAHTGIQKVDRQTVPELDEIIAQHNDVQGQLDKADAGLNPLGVAIGAVPFDIDPSKVLSGQTHFDQINARAVAAVTNTISLFNFSNQLGQLLRRNQDTQDQLATNTNDKERDLKNRMIELYGYPYAGDIGPAETYPTGYDGPDLYHYMYVNPSDLTGEPGKPQMSITAFFKGIQTNGAVAPLNSQRHFPQDVPDPSAVYVPPGNTFQVTFPFSTGDYGLVAPDSWGVRRAAGKLQINLSDLLRAEAKLKGAIVKYDLLRKQIDDTTDILEAQYNLNRDKIAIKSTEFGIATLASAVRTSLKQTAILSKRMASLLDKVGDAAAQTLPLSVGLSSDVFAPARGAVKTITVSSSQAFNLVGDEVEFAEYTIKEAEALAKLTTGLALEVESQKYDVIQKVRALAQLIRTEVGVRYELFELREALAQAVENYRATLAQADRIAQERIGFRRAVSATTQQARYTDMAFRIFQNDALQKYRAQFDLAARYTYLAAKAYDYETCLLGNGSGVGQRFLTDIVRQRSLGQIVGGFPVSGSVGLADPLARLGQNFEVYRGQLGFNNPETETGRFSLRQEALRITKPVGTATDPEALRKWQNVLQSSIVPDLWKVPEFRKYCRPFAPESAGPQPGLVIRFSTTVTFGLNYFGWPLGGGDNAYDPSRFATKVRSAGVWFEKYNSAGLSNTPRVYLVPVGDDFLRSPSGDGQDMRTFSVVDQKLPVPFPIGTSDLTNPAWIPANDSLNEDFGGIRRFSSFRAYHDGGTFTAAETISDSRLIGRSVWNTQWLLIIPGGTFLNDPDQGMQTFINSVSDIRVFFQTYSYSGN